MVPGWTTVTIPAFFTDRFHLQSLVNSFYLGVGVTLLTLIVAYPAALFMARLRGRAMFFVVGLAVFSPILVSIVVRAYGWQLLLSNNGVINYVLLGLGLTEQPVRMMFNWTGVIISMVHIELPFMLFPILTVLLQLPEQLVEAARDLGASSYAAWRRVILPLSLPGVLSGCQIVFTTAISAFASPTILGGGRVQVMPVTIYQNIVSLDWPMGAVQSVVLLAFSLVLVVLFTSLLRVRTAWSGTGR